MTLRKTTITGAGAVMIKAKVLSAVIEHHVEVQIIQFNFRHRSISGADQIEGQFPSFCAQINLSSGTLNIHIVAAGIQIKHGGV